jgi:hypothetical protein
MLQLNGGVVVCHHPTAKQRAKLKNNRKFKSLVRKSSKISEHKVARTEKKIRAETETLLDLYL